MDWSRIKNIIIIFLIVLNIFLLAMMGVTTYRENYISPDVLNSALKVLKKDGFLCEPDIMPDMYIDAVVLKTEFYSAIELSEIFYKKQVPFRTSKDTLIAENNGGKLSVSSNYFLFENGSTPVKASELRLRHALRKAGIDMSYSVFDKSTGYFYMMHRSSNLFNMYLHAEVDKSGNLCRVEAQWPKSVKPSSRKRISFCDKAVSLSDYFKVAGRISQIELGYELKSESEDSFSFEPSWRVSTEDETQIIPAI